MSGAVVAFFWGAFFGTVLLILAGALAAFVLSHQRVALAAGLTAVVSALFVVSYLGWLPLGEPATEDRVLALIGLFSAIMLGLMLLADLGLLRERRRRRSVLARMLALAAVTVVVSWLLDPWPALALSCAAAGGVAVAALVAGIRSAERGDRLAWVAVFAVACMLLSLAGVSWIALDRRGVPPLVHVASALTGMAYLSGIGVMLWLRYSYLLELREVRAQGPRYDPITRMPSNVATGQLVAQAFQRHHDPNRPVVLIAVCIGNLYALENLHGRAALNHALFVCATRLRRCAPPEMDIGRLFEDGFLLLSRDARDLDRLVQVGRLIAKRLSRPVTLSTGADAPGDDLRTEWAAQVGVGLLATTAQSQPAAVVSKVRDMSRTAWSYASRVAWLDQASDMITELPVGDTRG
jgi:GGDEF domain-containing protein